MEHGTAVKLLCRKITVNRFAVSVCELHPLAPHCWLGDSQEVAVSGAPARQTTNQQPPRSASHLALPAHRRLRTTYLGRLPRVVEHLPSFRLRFKNPTVIGARV